MHELRFRQVHLDFHTSPDIPGIGSRFDKKHWQDMLKKGHVDSITCFSSCHHGWSYHPTKVGAMHPHLDSGFNLLRAQMDASHEIGVKVPVYLTAGVNNLAAERHPEWREITAEGRFWGWSNNPLTPGFKTMCFNTPYLDFLCDMIKETLEMFPDADGVFLDIITQAPCCCKWCMADMKKEGYDPTRPEEVERFARRTLLKYYQKTEETVHAINPDMPLFHNSGHVYHDRRDILPYFTHLELESLPTGGWGYDHYPMTAAYCRNLDHDFLGMTGKFHTTWGEFGGYKHPNALRYECAAMIAQGSKCSIGDQMHPAGKLEESTYELIGAAYSEVEQKEPWCKGAETAANIALISNDCYNHTRTSPSLLGASRIFLEEHLFFDILDDQMDWTPYQIIVIADDIRITPGLQAKIDAHLAKGGKLILSGNSVLKKDSDDYAVTLPVTDEGLNELCPDFVQAAEGIAPDYMKAPFVMYKPSRRIKITDGSLSLGKIYDPYFNRTYEHFCSHQHTPYQPDPSGYDAGVMTKNILYFAHPVFFIYAWKGNVGLKKFVANAIRKFAGEDIQIGTNLPSQGVATLMKQKAENRYILHLLYAGTIKRGDGIEVIEELNPLYDVAASVKIPETVKKITLEPQGTEVPVKEVNGRYEVRLDQFTCHQMIVFHI